ILGGGDGIGNGGDAGNGGDGICGNGDDSGVSDDGGGVVKARSLLTSSVTPPNWVAAE
ncbi:hypothetical protein Tco_0334676, partial [Tanacetum coccineum]